jgi:hypothetical protein
MLKVSMVGCKVMIQFFGLNIRIKIRYATFKSIIKITMTIGFENIDSIPQLIKDFYHNLDGFRDKSFGLDNFKIRLQRNKMLFLMSKEKTLQYNFFSEQEEQMSPNNWRICFF